MTRKIDPEYKRAWYAKNKARVNADLRVRYANDKEYRTRKDANNQRWRDAHPEAWRVIQARYDAKRRKLARAYPAYNAAAEIRTRELMKIEIYAAAKKALPTKLPSFIRDDVITDIVLAYLENEIQIEDVTVKARQYLAAYYRMFDQWKTTPLEANKLLYPVDETE